MQAVKEVEFANVPLPLLDQVIPDVFVALAPVVIFIAPLFEQTLSAVPATAVGLVTEIKVSLEIEEGQTPFEIVH